MKKHIAKVIATTVTTSLLLIGVVVVQSQSSDSSRVTVAIRSKNSLLMAKTTCAAGFLEHRLTHTTKARDEQRAVFDSNGSGVAVADLDDDGLSDVVLGNLADNVSLLWNQGDFRFAKKNLVNRLDIAEQNTRAVAVVDVNADTKLDIVFTHTAGAITVWYNQGKRQFVQATLEGVNVPAYTMLWDDVDNDGDLDLVTSSYDALLEAEQKDSFMLTGGAGTVLYTNNAGVFTANRLTKSAQTLALLMFDMNQDGQRDLIIGNDFADPDTYWLNSKTGFSTTQPFKRITKNTMGFSSADIDNNGTFELFATDMKPKFDNLETIAKWMPFMERTYQKLQYKSLQRAENVLQTWTGNGYQNMAYEQNIDATGWSWSAQFGDLDNDGFQDLYIVNGMIDKENLKYLVNNELIEKNQTYRNYRGTFQKESTWNLDTQASGRGMVMADLNNDGRLDIVINNLETPAQIFENQICNGDSLEIHLAWSQVKNTKALGAILKLYTSAGIMQRELLNQSGYLSSNDTKLHFGFNKGTTLEKLEVHWSDGAISTLEKPQANSLLEITRDGGQ